MTYEDVQNIATFLEDAKRILIVQADNPDGDSLGSALALENIVADLGKEPFLYCGVDVPAHLHYVAGWSRVQKQLPPAFDVSIIVDTSSLSLLEHLSVSGEISQLRNRPSLVLDHHATPSSIDFASILYQYPAVATGEIIYEIASRLNWKLNQEALDMLAVSILSDSLGLMSVATTARSIHIIAELVEKGVSLSALETARREMMRKSPELTHYKGRLLERIEYFDNDKIAVIAIPWEEIATYSPLYNPSMLALDDMRLTEGTQLAIAFKIYRDGKITAKIRANHNIDIADKLAEAFGGGGHRYAAGFKISDGRPYAEIKASCIDYAAELLAQLPTAVA